MDLMHAKIKNADSKQGHGCSASKEAGSGKLARSSQQQRPERRVQAELLFGYQFLQLSQEGKLLPFPHQGIYL